MARKHTIFPAELPESWASDWGEDEYGIFMGFTYKGVRQDFRWIEPGTFQMGSPKNEPERRENETQHQVTLTKGFWLADSTVTQALWGAVMGENPSRFKGTERPVENVSWKDAQAFIHKMNGMKPELKLCLPSEAQWEYACRAGTTTPFYFGGQINSEWVNFDGTEPYNKSKQSEYRERTIEVRSLPSNDWGLFEMHGNVWEWCQDWYGEYSVKSVVDPQGAESGIYRVLRGGSWIYGGWCCRSAYRFIIRNPTERYGNLGFRLALGL
jgi:formylglycine-generating enzyme required for sulfatase activity